MNSQVSDYYHMRLPGQDHLINIPEPFKSKLKSASVNEWVSLTKTVSGYRIDDEFVYLSSVAGRPFRLTLGRAK